MEIRSYRRVFDLERRVYSVDRLRLNPGGVPVRGIVYFVVILAVSAIAARLPLLDGVMRALPWYLRDLALPGASATVLSVIRVEGRTFHLAARALVRHAFGPRRLADWARTPAAGRRWQPSDIVLLPDGSDGRMRRLIYTGPGAVLVALEHELAGPATAHRRGGVARRRSRATVTVRQLPNGRALSRGQVVSLAAGARLLVHSYEPTRR
jgi:hypothetical protein